MADQIREFLSVVFESDMQNVSDGVIIAMAVVLGLIVVMSIFALGVQIVLAIKYVKYNRQQNSAKMTGEQVARKLLDEHQLQDIQVKTSGSLLYGNSYSHYFKKVRLRRRTWKKDSLTSLGIAAQEASLAILDREGDPDMRTRVRLTPFIYAGPLMFIPLVLIGVILDLIVFKSNFATWTIALAAIGLVFYLIAFAMSIYVLKTETKAQKRACKILREQKIATTSEIEMLKKLFKLYNIEYVNNMIIALLEVVYRVLEIVALVEDKK